MAEHVFTAKIKEILHKYFGENTEDVFQNSYLVRYINNKTRSAGKGSKSRGSFHPLAVIYVLVEDYLTKGFDKSGLYSSYKGAVFTQIKTRAAELPFCKMIQNHSFNNRVNSEFEKYFKEETNIIPIPRDLKTQRYWINEHLLIVKGGNIANSIIEIIQAYFDIKQDSFHRFIKQCEELQNWEVKDPNTAKDFIVSLLAPNVDARLFEIVSYGILKYYYHDKTIFWGYSTEELKEDNLVLYKTGRTNANDGGIDFVMKPLGTFFQVTETTDFKKYFLDIDKVQKYPISFVIKSLESEEELRTKIQGNAKKVYAVDEIVNKYMACIEEIINIDKLKRYFDEAVVSKRLKNILEEIILQSKVEFNIDDDDENAS